MADDLRTSGFKVTIEGLTLKDEEWESITGLGLELEDITNQRGPASEPMTNVPGRPNVMDVVFTRQFTGDKSFINWMNEVSKDQKQTKSVSIIMTNALGEDALRINLNGAWPKTWTPPSLSQTAGGNDLPLETIVLSCHSIEIG